MFLQRTEMREGTSCVVKGDQTSKIQVDACLPKETIMPGTRIYKLKRSDFSRRVSLSGFLKSGNSGQETHEGLAARYSIDLPGPRTKPH